MRESRKEKDADRMAWAHYAMGILFGFLALIVGPTTVMLLGHLLVVSGIVIGRYLHPNARFYPSWPLAILAGIFTNISMLFILYEVYALTLPYDIMVPAHEQQSEFPRLYK